MQGYAYSVFSLAAIAIHLIINYSLLISRGEDSIRDKRYRGFLIGILAYYITDALWGILAGLGWTKLLYLDTVFFFLSLAMFVFMWCRFVIVYLNLEKWVTCVLPWLGYASLAFNLVALAVNPFNNCFFHLNAQGNYQTGCARDIAFWILVAFNVLMAIFAFVKFLGNQDSIRRRSMLIFLCCITFAVAIALQIIWPLTPFTSLGCLIGNCFLHVFVIADEQTAKHLAELEEALERARAAEKARSMFFSIVSHDIRTPLNAILGYSELLQDGVKSPAEKDEALKSIRASGMKLLQLINDVLDLAKMDSGKMTLCPKPVQLSQLTDDVFTSFQIAAAKKGIELINQTASVPTVLLDEHYFRQILFNLIGNAVKFTARGTVTVAASYAGKDLEISVSDTGCGIVPDMMTCIFDPFVQGQDPSRAADRIDGTGLGLSICRSLIEAMDGELVVESKLGRGSMFKIRIPNIVNSEEMAHPVAGPKPGVAVKRLPEHVLVVDDSPVNRKVLTAFLKKAGIISIGHAGDGCEAFAELDSAENEGHPYDLIFSDLWMPNMNGIEFIEKLRNDTRFNRLPVFAVTADTECKNDSRTNLFTGILLKPLTYEKLVEVFNIMGC